MKRILLIASLALFGFGQTSAQSTLIDLDFDETTDFDDVYSLDADGDGAVWFNIYTSIPNSEVVGIYGGFAYSASYDEGPPEVALTPDNLLILPVVTIPEGATNVEAKVKIGSFDFTYFAEHYAIYAIPGDEATTDLILNVIDDYNDVAEVVALLGEPLLEETLTTPMASDKILDLSAYEGQSVRLVVRHYDCTNQYFIGVDGYTVTADVLGVTDYASSLVKVYPNPATDIVNISLTEAEGSQVRIFDLNGRQVVSQPLIGSNAAINISGLASGIYAMEIETDQGKAMKKIIKE